MAKCSRTESSQTESSLLALNARKTHHLCAFVVANGRFIAPQTEYRIHLIFGIL
jgi:hypothetical protein